MIGKNLFLKCTLALVCTIAATGFQQIPVTRSNRLPVALSSEADASPPEPKTPEPPALYARCGRCEASYILTEEDIGTGRGRRLECSVCGHTWFQSRDRLLSVNNGFELIELPETDRTRIAKNIEEGKSPKFVGDMKLYVGNIAFGCTEEDLFNLFAEVGDVGDVALVRDEEGRNRGFGFVTMRQIDHGELAVQNLDGVPLNGRNIAVRPSNN